MSLSDQLWSPTSVQVTVLQARGLRIKGKSGTNDAYAVMQVGKEKYQTSVAEKSVAPMWKEEASFDLPSAHQGGSERGTLHVHVLHRALVGPDKLLGQAVINLLLLSEDKTRDKTQWFKLLDKAGKPDKDRGEVLVDIQFMRNNMTASMFDISAAGKSRSRLSKFKDKVRGKKRDSLSETASNVVPSFTQVLTDSEDEGNSDVEGTAGQDEKKKKKKVKSLFSHKSNLQKSLSQSMSVLPGKNSSLSGSMSSGLNVESSEGKKKFKFMIHKRTGSSDKKDGQQKLGPEQSNLCINGSHIYCDEPPPRTSRVGSNFSLASSGVGSMEDSSPPSVGSSRSVQHHSPWTEEEEEEEIGDDAKQEVDEEREQFRRQELEKLAEEESRIEEEERRRIEEEENEKKHEEEQLKREKEEEERRLQEEERQREEEERRREEEVRIEQERLKIEEQKKQAAEKLRVEEERKRQEEEQREIEKRKTEEEERRKMEEEQQRREELEKHEKERVRIEKEEQKRHEEEERKQKAEEEERDREKKRIEEEEKAKKEIQERQLEEEKRQKELMEEQVRIRKEEERFRMEMERAEEERRIQEERKLEEERKRHEEEEKKQKEEEERRRHKREEEERIKKEKEEEERLMEEERRLEELKEEQERIRKEEERVKMEKQRAKEEQRRKREEEEERVRKEREEYERLVEEKRKQKEEEERKRMEEEEKRRRQEEEALQMERLAEEKRRQEEERKRRIEEEERVVMEETQRLNKKTLEKQDSTNPFDEGDEDNLLEDDAPSVQQRCKLPSERNTGSYIEKEKRQAPKPPRINSSKRQREAQNEAKVNKSSREKEVKTASVLPQRSVQRISPTSASYVQTKSNKQPEHIPNTARATSQGKRPAPQRPGSAGEDDLSSKGQISYGPVPESRQTPAVYGLNPFEDDEDVDELMEQDTTATIDTSTSVQEMTGKDTVSQIKIKSSKSAHAPTPPANKPHASITSVKQSTNRGHNVTFSETKDAAPVRETLREESQSVKEEAVKNDAPPVPSRRLQPVRPLNPLDQQPISAVQEETDNKSTAEIINGQGKAKVSGNGPYSLLTQEELISLVLKQESQLSEKNKKISELEQYIDNLLVRVIEEAPSILMTLASVK